MAPTILGIVNTAPDSFAGSPPDPLAAAHAMLQAGADALDIGGESTRPGARAVDPDEEQRRVLPLIRALAGPGATLSIDTRNAATARAALDAGATIVNDVSGLAHDPAMAPLIARAGCRCILMHMRGTPETMQSLATYTDLIGEIRHELGQVLDRARAAGIARDAIILDPGIGFAKTAAHNIEILRRLPELAELGFPLLLGVSRKSFIGRLAGEPNPADRDPGSIAAALFALDRGAAWLRVHNVAATMQAVRVWRALKP